MEHHAFKIASTFDPQGDQPKAIAELAKGIKEGKRHQTLLGGYRYRQNVYNE